MEACRLGLRILRHSRDCGISSALLLKRMGLRWTELGQPTIA